MLEDALFIWKLNRGDKSALASIYEKYKDDLITLGAVFAGTNINTLAG